MDASEVRAALARRWPDDRYLHIPEAPLDPWRQGTKIDVLIVALWQSLKLELDAVEIKVSYQDWKREIEQRQLLYVDTEGLRHHCHNMIQARWYETNRPGGRIVREVTEDTGKSWQWRQHAHRFWIACPAPLAERIAPELPEGWGLIGCYEHSTTVVAKPAMNTSPDLLNWPKIIGLLRAAADCGLNALSRAEARGERVARQRLAAELTYSDQRHTDDWDEILALREKVRLLELKGDA